MAENTKIQWATHTFNPWRGCQKIAPGCANCYADAQSKRNPGTLGVWGPNGTRVVASEAMWREPVKWDSIAAKSFASWEFAIRTAVSEYDYVGPYERPRVFCASLADVFEQWNGHVLNSRGEVIADCRNCGFSGVIGAIPGAGNCCAKCKSGAITTGTLCGSRARLFRLWRSTLNLDWLVLTKRIENAQRMLDGRHENLWLGTSIACQEDADRNIPELLKCRDLAANLFVSIEPLIGPVDICSCRSDKLPGTLGHLPSCWLRQLDWVIVGGESGPHARPCNVEWIRSIVRQCQAAGVPCFVKQLGANAQHSHGEPVGWPERTRLRDPKGGDPAEWPEDLRVREVAS